MRNIEETINSTLLIKGDLDQAYSLIKERLENIRINELIYSAKYNNTIARIENAVLADLQRWHNDTLDYEKDRLAPTGALLHFSHNRNAES
jgi:hypothetical protein